MPSPSVTASKGALERAAADVVVVGAVSGPDGLVLDAAAAVVADDLLAGLEAVGFTGTRGTTARLPLPGAKAPSALVVGLGDPSDDPDVLRAAAATAVASVGEATKVAMALAHDQAQAQAVAEGVLLGTYTFDTFRTAAGIEQRTDPKVTAVAIHTVAGNVAAVKAGIAVGTAAAGAARLVRDLVNTPPDAKRPPALAKRAAEELKDLGVKVRTLDEKALAKGGYGGILGVGQGSAEPPRLVELTWAPKDATGHVALVGKGITFDTGGISIKPTSSMMTMKMDMAGAATVLAVVKAVAQLELPIRVTGFLALAENMPSGTAIRPSDVLTMRSGATVEVLNTDAEGRLVLADALHDASALTPDCIVDMATLTGAVVHALGKKVGAVIARDDALADELLAAGERVSEPFSRLPLCKDVYGKDLASDTADIKNAYIGDGAGTIKAALFLEHFVADDIPWAHLDIAGVAWSDSAEGYLTKGGTGVAARLLVDWLRTRADAAA